MLTVAHERSYDACVATKTCGATYHSRGKDYVCAREAGHGGRHEAVGRSAGRPELGNAARRRNVTVKFTDGEYEDLEAAAKEEVLPVADYIRAAVKLAIARGSTR